MDILRFHCGVRGYLAAYSLEGAMTMHGFLMDADYSQLKTAIKRAEEIAISNRIFKLGIHVSVSDQRSVYVGPDVDVEIALVEHGLRRLKDQRAA